MRQRDRQSGFGSTAILLLVLVVAVLAVTGVVVYQHHKSGNTKTSAAVSQAETTTQPKSTTTTQPAQTATKYLTIKEWGVKLPLPDDIKDAYYVPSTGSVDAGGTPNTIWVGLKSLDSSGCDAAKANNGGKPLASIVRALPTDTDPVSGALYTQLYPNGVTIGKYYYFYTTWSKGNNCTSAATFTKIDSSLNSAVKSSSTSN